jgi:3,4-dihydroxyphenylacetate 2,3-dioxygenase
MTPASELVSRRVPAPRFNIVRSAYVELQVCDLAASERFYVDVLGLVVSARDRETLYLRGWEERLHHSIVLREGAFPAAVRAGFRVFSESDLDLLADEFERRGCESQWVDGGHLGAGRALRVWDPFGFPLEFFYEMAQFETRLQRFHEQRGAPIMRLDHFNFHSPRVEEGVAFWLELGFGCSEYISTDDEDERLTGAWLRRKPTVHDIAFTVGRGPRLHHVGMFVAEPAGILRACDQLAASGFASAIERGPGRHGVSNAFFVYLRDPDGHRIELYSCDYYTGDPDHLPVRWSVSDPCCRSFWGAQAPDSWYDESSVVLAPDGSPTSTHAADVDERTARSQILA